MNWFRARFILTLCLICLPQTLLATHNPEAQATVPAIRPGETLSDYVLRLQDRQLGYLPGLTWNVPTAMHSQGKIKSRLLTYVMAAPEVRPPAEALSRIGKLLHALPVTGRIRLPRQEPWWLRVHPDQDPILDYDHSVALPAVPDWVEVLGSDGVGCLAKHENGAVARDYLRACLGKQADAVDSVWLVQADGIVEYLPVAQWNYRPQDEPAPGARIWAPGANSGWNHAFSTDFADFLATQSVAQPLFAHRVNQPVPVQRDPVVDSRRVPEVTANDWGVTGLMRTPSARMAARGHGSFSVYNAQPYRNINFILQPLDWLETGFRYTVITNRLYGADIAGDKAYLDKSIDAKFRLFAETSLTPQIALGFQDLGGTGFWGSEYLVASKRFGPLDFNLGMAWGYLAGTGNVRNPLSMIFGKGFNSRPTLDSGAGGTVNISRFFRGNAALFGGVQYTTPIPGLTFKVELDGNNYQNEPLDNNLKRGAPVNLGLVYKYGDNLDLSFGVERGNTVMLNFNFHGALDKLNAAKLLDPPASAVRRERPLAEPDWSRTAADLAQQSGWKVLNIERRPGELRVTFEKLSGSYWTERLKRIAAVLHRDAPADINRFRIVLTEYTMAIGEHEILRDTWVNEHFRYQAALAYFESMAAAEPQGNGPGKSLWADKADAFSFGLRPNYAQNVGGPNNPLLFQLGVAAVMDWRIAPQTWLSGQVVRRMLDNYAGFVYDGPSNLPRVRTDIRQYLISSKTTLPNLSLTHVKQIKDDQFVSVYGGYLEWMYAGVGMEWLYRPWNSPFAFGVDINRVQQRDFRQNFQLYQYKVNTGHGTLYWDTGWNNVHVNVQIGQYLAHDKGATLEVYRTFKNGVTMGAFATRTNISSIEFGEGSFDKGIFVRIPFEAMLPISTGGVANLMWDPLTRDGGARLGRPYSLYDLTGGRDWKQSRYALPTRKPGYNPDEAPDQGLASFFGDLGAAAVDTPRAYISSANGDALTASALAVLAASTLDRPVATWMAKHQTGVWNRLGKLTGYAPYIAAGSVGALWWGAGGESASDTAWTSIKAATVTLGMQALLKKGVGRSRPVEGVGSQHFNWGKGTGNSSFPSQEVGATTALVTPFAERYGADWLYLFSFATAFSRSQQQMHFVSDVVGGGMLGFNIGAIQLDRDRKVRLEVGTDRTIRAQVPF